MITYHPKTKCISDWILSSKEEASLCDAIFQIALDEYSGDLVDLREIVQKLLKDLKK